MSEHAKNLQNRRDSLDPCHSKVLNLTSFDISRMKLKMKLQLRALKKITEEVVQEGDNHVVVIPANVFENPSDTVLQHSYEELNGRYGSATIEQLRMFFRKGMPKNTTTATSTIGLFFIFLSKILSTLESCFS